MLKPISRVVFLVSCLAIGASSTSPAQAVRTPVVSIGFGASVPLSPAGAFSFSRAGPSVVVVLAPVRRVPLHLMFESSFMPQDGVCIREPCSRPPPAIMLATLLGTRVRLNRGAARVYVPLSAGLLLPFDVGVLVPAPLLSAGLGLEHSIWAHIRVFEEIAYMRGIGAFYHSVPPPPRFQFTHDDVAYAAFRVGLSLR